MKSLFSTRLEIALAHRGMTANAADIATGFTKGLTGRIVGGKRGARPTAATVQRYADVLNVNPIWLAGGDAGMLQNVSNVVPDAQPNRVEVYAEEAFVKAPPELQAWFTRLRKTPDLSPPEWRTVLKSGVCLHAHGFLKVAAVKKLE